jgi:hypothetical protein
MPMRSGEVARNVFGWLLPPLALMFNDWSDFFPFADHSDLRFQVIGEGLEVVALIVLGWQLQAFLKRRGDSEQQPMSFRSRIILAGFFAIFLLTLFWRDFFPNDQFGLSAGAIDFFYASLGGMGGVAISYLLETKRGKLSKKEETSIA